MIRKERARALIYPPQADLVQLFVDISDDRNRDQAEGRSIGLKRLTPGESSRTRGPRLSVVTWDADTATARQIQEVCGYVRLLARIRRLCDGVSHRQNLARQDHRGPR